MGDGSGNTLNWPLQLQLTMARALLRRPRLLLVDDADQFASAMGKERFVSILRHLQRHDRVTIVMAAAQPELFLASSAVGGGGCCGGQRGSSGSFEADVYKLQDGLLRKCA